MSCDLLIGRAAYNVAGNASVVGSAEDADYPAAYLYDGNLARPAKMTTTSGSWVFNFGSPQRVDLFAFGPHNLDAGLAVQLQANASDSWGAPTISASVTIPSDREDLQSVNPWLDVTGVSGYSTSGFQYWRLNISGSNSAAIAIGEVALYSQHTTIRNFRVGVDEVESQAAVTHATLYGVETVYALGVVRRRLTGETFLTAAQIATLQSVYRGGNGHNDWHLIVLEDTVNDARFVRFDGETLSFSRLGNGIHRVPLSMTEVSRGLYL